MDAKGFVTLGPYAPVKNQGQVSSITLTPEGFLRVAEQNAPGFEDDVNNVAAFAWKPVQGQPYSPSLYFQSAQAGATGTIKAAPAQLFGLHATNKNAAVRYLQIFDSTGATTTIVAEFLIQIGGSVTIGPDMLTLSGIRLGTGLTYGFSTTEGSFVAGTPADHGLTATYL